MANKVMFVKTTIRGLKVEASFVETNTYAYSDERSRNSVRIIRIESFREDFPKSKKEAIEYLHSNY